MLAILHWVNTFLSNQLTVFEKYKERANELCPLVKALVTKPYTLSSVPRTHMIEEKSNWLSDKSFQNNLSESFIY